MPGDRILLNRLERRLAEIETELEHLELAVQRLEQPRVDRQVAGDESVDLVSAPDDVEDRVGDRLGAAARRIRQAAQHAEHHDEDRHLRDDRQTRRHRVHLVLLVELHHLFVELLLVVAMLVLEPTHLRRDLLHLEHALGALQRQRCGDRHDHDRHQGDRDDVTVRQVVEPRQHRGGNLEHVSSPRRWGQSRWDQRRWDQRSSNGRRSAAGSGTGRGRTRMVRTDDIVQRRRTVNSSPRRVPCTSNASAAYDEHDGKNRHGDGRPSTRRWYQAIDRSAHRWVGVIGRSELIAGRVSTGVPPAQHVSDRTSVRSPGARHPIRYSPLVRSSSANTARKRRRRRLRVTALPTARLIANATCAVFDDGSGR